MTTDHSPSPAKASAPPTPPLPADAAATVAMIAGTLLASWYGADEMSPRTAADVAADAWTLYRAVLSAD